MNAATPAELLEEQDIAESESERLADRCQGEPANVPPRVQACVDAAPPSVRGLLHRVFSHNAPPSQAIKARCLQCTNYQRDEITACRTVDCALHAYRPFQK